MLCDGRYANCSLRLLHLKVRSVPTVCRQSSLLRGFCLGKLRLADAILSNEFIFRNDLFSVVLTKEKHFSIVKRVAQEFAQIAAWPCNAMLYVQFLAQQVHGIGGSRIQFKYFLHDARTKLIHHNISTLRVLLMAIRLCAVSVPSRGVHCR